MPAFAAALQTAPVQPDLSAVKTRQQGAWSSGDYAVVGTTLQIVGEDLCETLDLRPGSKVLDVAAGNGNATLAAARRWCDVTSTDYVPALLEGGRARAAALSWSGVNITPNVETTTSKLLSANGRSSASATRKSTLSRSAAARARPPSSSAGT